MVGERGGGGERGERGERGEGGQGGRGGGRGGEGMLGGHGLFPAATPLPHTTGIAVGAEF